MGTHADGITVYTTSDTILIAWNKVYETRSPMTLSESTNLYYYRNLIDAHNNDGADAVNEWGSLGADGNIWFLANTFVRCDQGDSLHDSINAGNDSSGVSYIYRNNILDGATHHSYIDRDYNLYVGLYSNQIPTSWYLNTNEIRDTLAAYPSAGWQSYAGNTFVDYVSTTGDFHLKDSSVAIGEGEDISSYITTLEGLFSGVDFARDLDNNVIPSDNRDLGAYIKD
jgi:hypothetical protein